MWSSSEPTSQPLDGAGLPAGQPSKPSSYSGVGGGLAMEENGGPILPEMPLEEEEEELGFALREWRRLNAIRLEEKERREKELIEGIIEEAEAYKAEFYRKRQLAVESNKSSNREREKLFLANREKFHAEAEKNYWSAISELIPREVPTIEKRGKKKQDEKKPSIVVIQGPKPGKPTDLSRMRHILLKLKHNTPPHMKFKLPTSDEPKTEEKGGVPEQPSAAASAAATPEPEVVPAAQG